MNFLKFKPVNLQPLVDWVVKQRTEVVLLLVQCAVGIYAVCYLVPAALDRQERIANSIEAHHTEQLKEMGKQFQTDQTRDAKAHEMLLQKLIGNKAHAADPDSVAVGQP